VRFRGDRLNAAASYKLRRRVNVYRPGHASWYGPGFYGRRTACGQIITGRILGVAHKTLPCGTRVTFRYGRRTVTAKVIDRGPFVAGREWDLTVATKRRLGFPSTGTVWSTR
jgi:rare lipoprotein A